MARDETIIDRAIDWHVRQAELRDDEWPGFVEWLEADPAHAAAYDSVAMSDATIGAAHFAPAGANDDHPATRHWPRWIGAAAIAATIAAVALPLIRPAPGGAQDFATQPGQRRTLALADGTRIDMSGGTRVRLASLSARSVALVEGEITLHVRHDAAHPFIVTSGTVALRDMGTVFDVARTGPRLDVQVAEGSVMFQPGREALTLRRGDALVVREDRGTVTRGRVSPDQVGGWRTGTLSFSNEPLGGVAMALKRLYGTNLTVTGRLSHRPFTGMIKLTGTADRDIPHLAALIGAEWRRDGERWVITDKTVAAR